MSKSSEPAYGKEKSLRTWRGLLLFGLSSASAFASATPLDWKWIERNVIDRVEVNGFRRVGVHFRSVSGDREAYNLQNDSGLGGRRFTDIGQLQITGRRVLGVLDFDASIQDSRFTDPQGEKLTLRYERRGFSLQAGDINGSLTNSNRFASFSRSLRGVQLGIRSGRLEARTLVSQAKARAETVTLAGNGSSGPYFLQTSQIVPDSERVQIDGQLLQRGRDYAISYESGSITFTDRTIPPSSTIAVTFESFGSNTRRGDIRGAGVTYDMGRAGRIGLTAMQQNARGGGGLSTRVDRFFGFGPASTPYVLQFQPLAARPITIRVNGILQVEGVDYVFDATNPATFFFTRFMPPTDEIDVIYTPVPRQTVDGDREVLGLDYRLPLGKSGTLTYTQARGILKSPVNPTSGTARGVTLDLAQGPWTLRANARDVPAGFVSVESMSFNRNERAYNLDVSYTPNPIWSARANQSNSVVSTRRITNNNQVVFDRSRVTSVGGQIQLDRSSQPWRLTYDRRQTRIRSNPSRADIWNLTTSRQQDKLTWRLGLNRTEGRGPVDFTPNAAQQSFLVNGINAGFNWTPAARFSLDGQTSLSSVRSGDESGTGRRYDLNASYLPSEALTLGFRYTDTDSGGVGGLGGFNDGTGVGLDGSGFTGTPGQIGLLGATGSRLASLVVDYRPNKRVTLALDAYVNRFTGSITSNSETRGFGLSAFYALSGDQRLNLRFDTSDTRFLGSSERSRATTMTASYDGRLGPRWTFAARGSALLTGGTSQFQRNGFTWETTATYQIRRRESLYFEFIGGGTSGYLSQSDLSAALVYQYQLVDQIFLNVGYRFRDVRNRDGAMSGAYRSGSFDIQLAYNLLR